MVICWWWYLPCIYGLWHSHKKRTFLLEFCGILRCSLYQNGETKVWFFKNFSWTIMRWCLSNLHRSLFLVFWFFLSITNEFVWVFFFFYVFLNFCVGAILWLTLSSLWPAGATASGPLCPLTWPQWSLTDFFVFSQGRMTWVYLLTSPAAS